ncbi:hypothetical protein L204_100508 [Cryptococcus depauperatus]|nr:ribosome production factor 1 [Cryptococcus depauperatus CBS 7855]
MPKDTKIKNALKRSEIHRKAKREKEQAKLQRRLEIKKAEKDKVSGMQLKKERLSKNIPVTLDNTRVFDSSSYLTADPVTLHNMERKIIEASQAVNAKTPESETYEHAIDNDRDMKALQAGPSTIRPAKISKDENEGDEVENDEEDENSEEENPSESQEDAHLQPPQDVSLTTPPRILITTSHSPCKFTYQFCEDLKNVFPGGEFFKRPRGKGFEIGRVARWAAKRGYGALIVVNEDHKKPNAVTLINLPAGPTAYFKLSGIVLSHDIYNHARPTPHSPELILNNFTTLLGNSVGRLFGSLFPPQPQFRGRQVVTLHNQRDYLFFRRHRYMFVSGTSTKLQEIGPRFTLKLRWLRKGLPSVTASDGRTTTSGDPEEMSESEDDNNQTDLHRREKEVQDVIMNNTSQSIKERVSEAVTVPALDEEQEYEWNWKPKMEISRRTFFL